MHFDLCIFNLLAAQAGNPRVGTKQGLRLLLGCERLRKLLSQLTDGSMTVENVKEDQDVTFKMSRAEMAHACAALLVRIEALVL